MSRSGRRRRGALLVALSVAAGGVAASRVERRERDVDARVGAPVPVVVAASDMPAGRRITGGDAARRLTVRDVPARYVPPDALSSPDQAVGGELAAPVPAGGYLTAGTLAGGPAATPDAPGRPGRGERAIEVAVTGGDDLHDAGEGARVDVLVTSERGEGRGRTYLALEDVELMGARAAGEAAGGGDGEGARGDTLARLRVTVRQAVFLAAAQSFARETRLLLRDPAERRRNGPVAVDGASL